MSYEIRIGDTLDDRFHITELIQRSGMSTIYKAIDCTNGTFVAIKVPHLELEGDAASFSRFEREEEIGAMLNHPGVLKIIPVESKSRPYIVMEYLEGRTLKHVFAENRLFPLPKAVDLVSRLCEILDYLHRHGIVHRDLKPANIMLCDDGSLRILDFGIAKYLASRRITFGGLSPKIGTPDYMAPEQIKGQRGDARTDIYSLGVIFYELAAGLLPFNGENVYELMNARLKSVPRPPREFDAKITPELEEIILHALEPEPDDRYVSAAAMKLELDSPESVQLTNRYKKMLRSVRSWKRPLKQAGVAIFVAAMPVIAFFLFFLMLQHQSAKR